MAEFQHGLCTCYEDIGTCAMVYCCPCYVAGKTAEAVGENCCLYGCATLTPCIVIANAMIRGKVREKYGIQGSFLNDILMHWCCICCAMVQDAREVKAHGDAPPGNSMARE